MKSSMTRLAVSFPTRLSIPFSIPFSVPFSARLFAGLSAGLSADLSIGLSNRLINRSFHFLFSRLIDRSFNRLFSPLISHLINRLLHPSFNRLINRSFIPPFSYLFTRLFPSLSACLSFCLSLSLYFSLSSCQSPSAVSVLTHRTDSVYIDKLIPYPLPSDSASIRALIACDENGRIAIRRLETANTKNVQLHFSVDSLGKIMAAMKIKRDTLYLPSKEIRVTQEVEIPVPVAPSLSRWETFKMETGGWAIGLLSGLGILAAWYIFRKKRGKILF